MPTQPIIDTRQFKDANKLLQYWQPDAASLPPLANKVENTDCRQVLGIPKLSLPMWEYGPSANTWFLGLRM